MVKDEKEMQEAYRQLSDSGRIDVLAYTNTVLKAENGIKKEYGLAASSAPEESRRSA
ncbi:MAG: hypothetical protein FWH41_04725 [Treponema sp.]|nr:hypothetical protein [Treponema sp.]